jgi:hypothetical protein
VQYSKAYGCDIYHVWLGAAAQRGVSFLPRQRQFLNQVGKKFGRCVIYGNLTLPFETHGNLPVCLDLYEYESVSGLLLDIHTYTEEFLWTWTALHFKDISLSKEQKY